MAPDDARRVTQVAAELRTFVEQQAALFITGERDHARDWDAYNRQTDRYIRIFGLILPLYLVAFGTIALWAHIRYGTP